MPPARNCANPGASVGAAPWGRGWRAAERALGPAAELLDSGNVGLQTPPPAWPWGRGCCAGESAVEW